MLLASRSGAKVRGHRARRHTTRSLRMESLENRELLTTTHIVLDFTPDSHSGSFVDTFTSTKLPGKNCAPSFLDFNKDGRVNATDAVIAAGQIASQVKSYFAGAATGYDVQFHYGDITSNTKWGTQWITYGAYYSNQEVAVMYFGGTNSSGSNTLGMSPVASPGYNVEGYGETYTRTIAGSMAQHASQVNSALFVKCVAQVAAHELGHIFGLQHPLTDNVHSNNIMNATTSLANPGTRGFVNAKVAVNRIGSQNAFQELRASFAGQSQQSGNNGLGGQYSTAADLASPVRGVTPGHADSNTVIANSDVGGKGILTAEAAQPLALTAAIRTVSDLVAVDVRGRHADKQSVARATQDPADVPPYSRSAPIPAPALSDSRLASRNNGVPSQASDSARATREHAAVDDWFASLGRDMLDLRLSVLCDPVMI
jgi:hypothetical protein